MSGPDLGGSDDAWPALPLDEWRPTKETLHRYCQMLGKVCLRLRPFHTHWVLAFLVYLQIAPVSRSSTTSSGPKPASASTSSVSAPGRGGEVLTSLLVREKRGVGAGCTCPSCATNVFRS